MDVCGDTGSSALRVTGCQSDFTGSWRAQSGDCSQLLRCPWLINFVLWQPALESQFACLLPVIIHSLFLSGNHMEASSDKPSHRRYMDGKPYDGSATEVFWCLRQTRASSLSAFTAAAELTGEGSFLQTELFLRTELIGSHVPRWSRGKLNEVLTFSLLHQETASICQVCDTPCDFRTLCWPSLLKSELWSVRLRLLLQSVLIPHPHPPTPLSKTCWMDCLQQSLHFSLPKQSVST